MLMFADVEILNLVRGQHSGDEIWSNFVFDLVIWLKSVTLVSRTQPSGPLCLWQCLYFSSNEHCITLFHFSNFTEIPRLPHGLLSISNMKIGEMIWAKNIRGDLAISKSPSKRKDFLFKSQIYSLRWKVACI